MLSGRPACLFNITVNPLLPLRPKDVAAESFGVPFRYHGRLLHLVCRCGPRGQTLRSPCKKRLDLRVTQRFYARDIHARIGCDAAMTARPDSAP
jgi:hypothetical protein